MTLASPNKIVNEYFAILRRLVYSVDDIKEPDIRRQQVTLCIFQSVTAVETFLNIYFRVIVSEKEFNRHEKYLIKTISDRESLDFKLKNWTKKIFGCDLNLNSGIGKSFFTLKKLRNTLMHFISTHETLKVPNLEIHGLVNISCYDKLKIEDAFNALEVAERFLCEIFRLRGIKEAEFNYMLQRWTGKLPS